MRFLEANFALILLVLFASWLVYLAARTDDKQVDEMAATIAGIFGAACYNRITGQGQRKD